MTGRKAGCACQLTLITQGLLLLGGCPDRSPAHTTPAPAPADSSSARLAAVPSPRPSPAGPPPGALPAPPRSCAADADCEVVMLPRCFGPGGCSPPCGRTYPLSPAALDRRHSAPYVAEVERLERARCNFPCSMCKGRAPPLPDPGQYRARCLESRCVLKGADKAPVVPGNQ